MSENQRANPLAVVLLAAILFLSGYQCCRLVQEWQNTEAANE